MDFGETSFGDFVNPVFDSSGEFQMDRTFLQWFLLCDKIPLRIARRDDGPAVLMDVPCTEWPPVPDVPTSPDLSAPDSNGKLRSSVLNAPSVMALSNRSALSSTFVASFGMRCEREPPQTRARRNSKWGRFLRRIRSVICCGCCRRS